jgi:hypothetical protein
MFVPPFSTSFSTILAGSNRALGADFFHNDTGRNQKPEGRNRKEIFLWSIRSEAGRLDSLQTKYYRQSNYSSKLYVILLPT